MTKTERICRNIIESGKIKIETMRNGRCVTCRKINRDKCVVLNMHGKRGEL